MEDRVLSIIHHRDRVLLERIRSGFGAGLLGGLYCKPQDGESCEEAMAAELSERGIVPLKYELRGVLAVAFQDSALELLTRVYEVTAYAGDVPQNDGLRWYARLPYSRMLPGYDLWLPRFLQGEGVLARMTYDSPKRPTLLTHSVFRSRRPKAWAAGA